MVTSSAPAIAAWGSGSIPTGDLSWAWSARPRASALWLPYRAVIRRVSRRRRRRVVLTRRLLNSRIISRAMAGRVLIRSSKSALDKAHNWASIVTSRLAVRGWANNNEISPTKLPGPKTAIVSLVSWLTTTT